MSNYDWKKCGELYPRALALAKDNCQRGKVSMMFDRADLLEQFISKAQSEIGVGNKFTYNDGRTGHVNLTAVIISVEKRGFVAQFEDRADTTFIEWNDDKWLRHIMFSN